MVRPIYTCYLDKTYFFYALSMIPHILAKKFSLCIDWHFQIKEMHKVINIQLNTPLFTDFIRISAPFDKNT